MALLYSLLKKVFFRLLLILYICISLVSINNCSKNQDSQSTSEKLRARKVLLIQNLEKEFNAESFNPLVKNLVNRNIVFDTSIVSYSQSGKTAYLKARISYKSENKYFGLFRCDSEIFEQFSKLKTNNILLVARISGFQNQQVKAISDSLDGKFTEVDLGDAVLITGDCLAVTAIPAFDSEI